MMFFNVMTYSLQSMQH